MNYVENFFDMNKIKILSSEETQQNITYKIPCSCDMNNCLTVVFNKKNDIPTVKCSNSKCSIKKWKQYKESIFIANKPLVTLNKDHPVPNQRKLISRVSSVPQIVEKQTAAQLEKEFLHLVINQAEYFCNEDMLPYCKVAFDNKKMVLAIGSKDFETWLRFQYFQFYANSMSNDSVGKLTQTLKMLAQTGGVVKEVPIRVHQTADGTVYYDLCDNSHVVEIKAEGTSIINNTNKEILFMKTSAMNPQVFPDLSARADELPSLVQSIIRVDNNNLLLICVYLASLFIKTINHPILMLHGDQGAAKSTTLRAISEIIDPNKKDLFKLSNDERDLVTCLSNNYFAPFDNAAKLNEVTSNILCMVVTGGSISRRSLYTDNDETIIKLKRCAAINGIAVVGNNSDLLDRSIVIALQRISEEEFITEEDYWRRTQSLTPKILGACFDAIHKAMAILPSVNLSKMPRMADFAKWGYAIAESIKVGYGESFLGFYAENLANGSNISIESNPFISCIAEFMSDIREWNGSVSDFLDALKNYAYENQYDMTDGSFPKAPNYLMKYLQPYKVALRVNGIVFTDPHNNGKYREITFKNNN